jgi:hypothetical protein
MKFQLIVPAKLSGLPAVAVYEKLSAAPPAGKRLEFIGPAKKFAGPNV